MKRKKNVVDIKKEYIKSLNYIKESKNFIYCSIILFFIFALIGFLFPAPEFISKQILEILRELVEKTQGMGAVELTGFILLNNFQSSLLGMILGIFFGIFPILVTILNGYILGFVSSLSVQAEGLSNLWRLFPHGIFELPAAFISFGLGIKLGTFIFKKDKLESFFEFLKNSLRVFFLIIVPLLIIAAIIEGVLIFLSP